MFNTDQEPETLVEAFLRGTFGFLLQIVRAALALFLIVAGAFGVFFSTVGGIVTFSLGILCLCAVFGVRYSLGSIHQIR